VVGHKKSAHCIRPRLVSEYLSFIKASSLGSESPQRVPFRTFCHVPTFLKIYNRTWGAINPTTEGVWFFLVCGRLCMVVVFWVSDSKCPLLM
jgi:hypothetical protein